MYVSRQVNKNVFYFSVNFNLPCTSYFILLSDFIYQMVPRLKLLYIILMALFASSTWTRPITRFQKRSGRGVWSRITQDLSNQKIEKLIRVGTLRDDISQTCWKCFLRFTSLNLRQKFRKTSILNPLRLRGWQLSQKNWTRQEFPIPFFSFCSLKWFHLWEIILALRLEDFSEHLSQFLGKFYRDYRTFQLLKGPVFSKLIVVLEGCQIPKKTFILGGKCWSMGLASYLGFQIQQRQINRWMISTRHLSRGHMRAQSVLPLSRLHYEIPLVVNNHILSRILVEVCKLCHQCLPFPLMWH